MVMFMIHNGKQIVHVISIIKAFSMASFKLRGGLFSPRNLSC